MISLNRNINNIFFIFVLSHLLIWTVVPTITNKNLPLDVIEALAWGSNLDWGFNKHPPGSAFFPEIFFQIFGAQDWAYYFLSSLFVVISFYFVFKVADEILSSKLLSLFSVLILEAIYFYNFTSPEFNVNVCQLPFWSLVVYFSWKIYSSKEIKLLDCFFIGLFSAIGFLSKYLFVYLLASIFLLFMYVILIKKDRKFDFKYFITLEVFVILLIPHFIWLYGNDFITIFYGLKRTGLEPSLLNHFEQPILFLFKQIGTLIPFFFLIWLLVKKIQFKFNVKDKKLLFLLVINLLPIFLILITSAIMGSKIRTMWMTPFYLYFGVLFIYLLKSQINVKRLNSFLYGFLFLFFLSPIIYSYVSISQTDKRTDYPGKEIASKVQLIWSKDFNGEIQFVTGDEWKAGNLSYHLKSRPVWEGSTNSEILKNASQFICVEDVCLGRY
ncbi:glycosyltransferase family 39 protein [Candidatus Pelagibacter sp.]|uniref:glycosyltransferase family 39 protein n=1 Tax=Candidatus Pelagibacter sp. TaxID=2024849 RepID=UPI003F845230